MLVIIAESKSILDICIHAHKKQKTDKSILYHSAHDISHSHPFSIHGSPLPIPYYISESTLYMLSTSNTEALFILGNLYAHSVLEGIVYVGALENNNFTETPPNTSLLLSAHTLLSSDNTTPIYLDMLVPCSDNEISFVNTNAYHIAHTIVRFMHTHTMSVLIIPKDLTILSNNSHALLVEKISSAIHTLESLAKNKHSLQKPISHIQTLLHCCTTSLLLSKTEEKKLCLLLEGAFSMALHHTAQKDLISKIHVLLENTETQCATNHETKKIHLRKECLSEIYKILTQSLY